MSITITANAEAKIRETVESGRYAGADQGHDDAGSRAGLWSLIT